VAIQSLQLVRLKTSELTRKLHAGHDDAVLAELKKMMAFYRGSLQGHLVILDAAIDVVALKSLRQFAVDAAKDSPSFRARLLADPSPFVLNIDANELEDQARHGELAGIASLLRRPQAKAGDFSVSHDQILTTLALRTPGRLFNGEYACLYKHDSAPVSWLFPGVRILVHTVCGAIEKNFRKIEENLAKVRAPLEV
jgi:hypothetical protein